MGYDTDWKDITGLSCHKCKAEHGIQCRQWTSFDEAHEDWHYRCLKCGSSWWVEGADY